MWCTYTNHSYLKIVLELLEANFYLFLVSGGVNRCSYIIRFDTVEHIMKNEKLKSKLTLKIYLSSHWVAQQGMTLPLKFKYSKLGWCIYLNCFY